MQPKPVAAVGVAILCLLTGGIRPADAHPSASVFTGTMHVSALLPLPDTTGFSTWSMVSATPSVGGVSGSGTMTGSCAHWVGEGTLRVDSAVDLSPAGTHAGPVTMVSVGRLVVMTGVWDDHVVTLTMTKRAMLSGAIGAPCFEGDAHGYDIAGVAAVVG